MISAGETRVKAGDAAKVARAWFREVKAEAKKASTHAASKGVDESKARRTVSHNTGFAGVSRFGEKAPDFSLEGRIAARIGDGVPTDAECHFLLLVFQKLPEEKFVKVMEKLVERDARIVSHRTFREKLDRDGKLAVNQALRRANENIAYRSVDFDIKDDEDFWARIDGSEHSDLIKRNAVVGMLKMAEKLGITDEIENA